MKTFSNQVDLTLLEKEEILSLVRDRQCDGSYYGRKDYYYKRLDSIIRKLEESINAKQF